MTTPRFGVRLLLLFALLAGQWVYATHTHDHEAPETGHICQLCLHAVQCDSCLPACKLPSPILAGQYIPNFQTATPAVAGYIRLHDARAPPGA
ncbi:MAG: hypothetical protein ABW076_16950 [Candidatus Thiodiazotropha sp.]